MARALTPERRTLLNADSARWRIAHPGQQRENTRRWRLANPDQYRSAMLLGRYGIDEGEYQRLLAAQGGVCAVCKQPPRHRNSAGDIQRLHVDHNHETGEVRGLLCLTCNRDLGIIEGPLFDALLAYRDAHSG